MRCIAEAYLPPSLGKLKKPRACEVFCFNSAVADVKDISCMAYNYQNILIDYLVENFMIFDLSVAVYFWRWVG